MQTKFINGGRLCNVDSIRLTWLVNKELERQITEGTTNSFFHS